MSFENSNVSDEKSRVYIHYGSPAWDPERWRSIEDRPYENKPSGGLWASAEDTEFGWADWCAKIERYRETLKESFTFQLDENANVLVLASVDDLAKLPEEPDFLGRTGGLCKNIQFSKLLDEGVDVIDFRLSEDPDLYFEMYGWDCDSVLVLNKDVIVV